MLRQGMYPLPASLPRVPGSDACGTVISTGPKVTRFSNGQKVCTLFNQGHIAGPLTPAIATTGLGGSLDGTLRQYAVFPESGLVLAPATLNEIEASTLTCAPLTAWNSLYGLTERALRPGDVVLTQGTGGVSLAALQFAVAAGATVIATTSSASKAEKLKKLGAHHIINYKENPNWGEEAKKLTPGGEG
jgi:NADPH:quinone reductase-like Zn-dependent oxidoreductase